MTDQHQQIGPYRLVRRLGQGGMGIVHLAHDADLRLVALKVLRPELAADADFRRRFTREAEAAGRVARFCTAPVLEAGLDGDIAYLVTEYVDGPDLASVIGAQGPMNGANLEALAVGVATALAAIHQAGVVHGDLKPSNILLSAVGPRVIDFGIARLAGATDTTQSAVVMGTPPYMAPEQADGRPATAASDVFAWGGVMAYAGVGRPPFGTGPAPQVLYRVVHHVPRLDGLDEQLRPLVEQALDKDPARRPTAQQLLDRLLGRESATPALATRMVSDSWTPLMPAREAPPARRLRVAPVVAVALALLVTAGTLAAWRPWDRPTTARPRTSTTTTVTATVTTAPPATAAPSPTGEQPARPAGDGKALAESDTFVTNAYDTSVPVHVRILSLERKGD
ncbi:serine/threonine-protein kinase [Nonomuraea aridisoli]|nr:serine/threonine-protein kinase [Nonomuraea aridisoli]